MANIEKTGDKRKPYRVRWRDPDGSERSRRCPDYETAKALKLDVERASALGRGWEPPDAQAPAAAPDLWQLVDAYLVEERHKRAPRTVDRKRQMVQGWLTWFQDHLGRLPQPPDLTRASLLEYLEHLTDPDTGRYVHGRGYATRRKHLQEVELAWRKLFESDELGIVPRPRMLDLPGRPPPERPAATWSEMDAVIAAGDGWRRDLAVVLRCTGLRLEQAMALRWEDLDRATGVLHVTSGKSVREKRGRYVPVARVLLRELNRWRVEGANDSQWIVTCPHAHRLPRARDMARLWRLPTRAGHVRRDAWEGRPHHAFRAGFMAGLKMAGADDEAVEFLVGHSRGVRAHYVDGTALPLRAAVDLVPELTLRQVLRLEDRRT